MSTASPRPQLELDELRRLKWLLGGLLALVSLATVFFLEVEALTLVGLVSALIVAVLVRPSLPARLPAWGWRLAVPLIIATGVADWALSRETLPALIRLDVLLVLYRAAGYRRQREDLQLIVLGLFLVVVAGVLTVSLGFAALLLLFTATALGFLFVVTLIDLRENTRTALTYAEMSQCPGWARGGWAPLFRRWRRVADWRMLGFASGLFVTVVLLSGLLFLLIPRFEFATGFFLDKYITRKAHTGFSESVRFGEVEELVRDDGIAMRVDLPADSATPPTPIYWRLVILDDYAPDGFRVSAGLKNELLRSQRFGQSARGRLASPHTPPAVPGTWTFYVEPGVSRFLPLPGGFAQLRLREPAFLQLLPATGIAALRTESVTLTAFQLENVEIGTLAREPRLVRQLAAAAANPRGDGPLILRGPLGPANQGMLAAALREIAGPDPVPDAAEFARRATAWLQQRHAYALSVRLPRGEGDDIVRWLGSNEPGHCEYFAAGLAVLCRQAGFPARIVAGFRGGTLNPYEHYFTVRNSDAHAWVEVFDGTGNWLRFDPTPRADGKPAATGTVSAWSQDKGWSARFDSLRMIWYRRIVNFDSRQQVQLIEQVRSFTTDSGAALRLRLENYSRRLRQWAAQPWDWRRALRVGGEALAGLTAGLALAAALGLGWGRLRRNRTGDPVRAEAGRWLRKISDHPAASRRATSANAEQIRERGAVVDALQRLRYGRKETWPEARSVFRRARRIPRE